VKLKIGEKLIIKEGKTGWGKTIAVTNKRLLILDKGKIIGETSVEDISEAYSETHFLTNLTQLKIRFKDGRKMSVIFRNKTNGHLYGGSDYADNDMLNMTNRYVKAINQAVNKKLPATKI
jgi:hypothetical protein